MYLGGMTDNATGLPARNIAPEEHLAFSDSAPWVENLELSG